MEEDQVFSGYIIGYTWKLRWK